MKSLTVIVIAIFMFNACRTIPEESESSTSPMPVTGINWGYPTKGTEQYALFEEMGITWLRTDFSWDKLEPRPGEWHFEETDEFCREAVARGYRITGVLGFDNFWIHENPEGKTQVDPDQIESYLNYVRTVTSRYRESVSEWEIWNEPNLPFHTFWTGTDGDFFFLLKEASAAIRESVPEAVILGGSLWRFDKNYITKLYRDGALENIDVFSYHPYYDTPDRILSQSRALQNHLKSLGFTGGFRITEVGFNTYGRLPTSCSPRAQGRLVLETLLKLGVLGHPYLIWYTLYNGESPGSGIWTDRYGVMVHRDDGTFAYKTGGWALRRYNELIAGQRVTSGITLSGDEKLLGKIDSHSFDKTVVLFTGKRELAFSLTGMDGITIYNCADGSVRECKEEPIPITLKKNEPLILILPENGEIVLSVDYGTRTAFAPHRN
ncbi:MAG: cellulase family glycosylhydrolase [Spirochaetales bacterium]|nr:cellulase family glycosylhydrolase [Spirochaetales bacterium]